MNLDALANKDIPAGLRGEITRYGGLNPFGRPFWRVVWAENVREQCFGTMSRMPRVEGSIDMAEVANLEAQSFESGEFWLPRYANQGAILERWFPGSTWGSREDWEQELAADGITPLKGPWPRQGDYFMVGEGFYPSMPTVGFWKQQISEEIYRMNHAPVDPATHLQNLLYVQRAQEAARRAAFLEEVNHIHRGTVEPMLATVGRTAQRLRDEVWADMGMEGHLAAG